MAQPQNPPPALHPSGAPLVPAMIGTPPPGTAEQQRPAQGPVLDPLEAADVVQLKSGGPDMTVRVVNGSQATCVWYNKENNICEYSFHRATLRKVGERTKG